jgi:hypothetical protein
MGAGGVSSAGTTRLSAKVGEELKEDFKEACEARGDTMTDVIEEKMAEVIAENGGPTLDDDDYYPTDPKLRELYEACLKYAVDLKIYQRRHAGSIAQETQQTNKSNLPDALIPLRHRGYIALGPTPIDLGGDAAARWRHWHVKPPCSDPEQWKYRENRGATSDE